MYTVRDWMTTVYNRAWPSQLCGLLSARQLLRIACTVEESPRTGGSIVMRANKNATRVEAKTAPVLKQLRKSELAKAVGGAGRKGGEAVKGRG